MSKEVKCVKCNKNFVDVNYMDKFPLIERIYCNECLDEVKK